MPSGRIVLSNRCLSGTSPMAWAMIRGHVAHRQTLPFESRAITARFFRNSLHHKGVVSLAENGRVALSASPCLSVYLGELHSGYTFAARSFQATPASHNFLGVSRKPWLCPFRVPDPTICPQMLIPVVELST